MSVILLLNVALVLAPASAYEDASLAFGEARYAVAAERYARAVDDIAKGLLDKTKEREVRERLALSLFLSDRKKGAQEAVAELCRRFSDYAPDPDRLPPEAVAFFGGASACARPASPAVEASQAASAPRAIAEPSRKRWSPAFLVPLGIGQFLAGSPVRASVFLTTQVSFAVLNIVGGVLLARQKVPGGEVLDLRAAEDARIMMNIGFFGLISAIIMGTLDGALWERQ